MRVLISFLMLLLSQISYAVVAEVATDTTKGKAIWQQQLKMNSKRELLV